MAKKSLLQQIQEAKKNVTKFLQGQATTYNKSKVAQAVKKVTTVPKQSSQSGYNPLLKGLALPKARENFAKANKTLRDQQVAVFTPENKRTAAQSQAAKDYLSSFDPSGVKVVGSVGKVGSKAAKPLIDKAVGKISRRLSQKSGKVVGQNSRIFDSKVASEIARLGAKMDVTGNVSIDETHKIMQLAKKHLNIPQKTFQRLGPDELLGELRSLLTRAQDEAFTPKNLTPPRPLTRRERVAQMRGLDGIPAGGKFDLKKIAPKQSVFGGVAGVETDEEGNVSFSPEKAALGIAGIVGAEKLGNKINLKNPKFNRDMITDYLRRKGSQPQIPPGVSQSAGKAVDEAIDPSLARTIPEASDPVKKVIDALKGSKSIRKEQELLYSKERGKRFGALMGVRAGAKGEAGYFQELSKLKGELPKAEFENIRGKVTQEDVDTLFDQIRSNPNVDEWDKLSAFSGLSKLVAKEGGTVPTKNELKLLNDVFGKEFTDAIMAKRTNWEKLMEAGGQALNLPRTLMSTVDLSAPLRQGIFLTGRPKQFLPAFVSMFKQVGSKKAYQAVQDSIRQKPSYPVMKQYGLALTDVGGLGPREEAFLSNWGEKIPVLKHVVGASNRAYTGFLNKLRADVFDDLYQKGAAMGLEEDPKFAKDLASFVNNATGRGDLGKLERSATALNGVFFSPRLMASRLNLLNPAYYVKLQPQVRKEALKSLFTFLGTGATVLALAKGAGADVETDPRSADFGKIKVGNTRYDIWGGFQQYIRLAAQLATGQVVSSTTGQVMNLGDLEEYKPLTRKDIVARFFEGKTAPVASFALDLLRGTNFIGEPLDFKNPNPLNNPIGQRFLPMVSQDLVDAYKEYGPKGIGMTLPSIFGISAQTYGGTAQIDSPEQAEGQSTITLYKYLKDEMTPQEANKYVEKLSEESPQKVSKLEKYRAIEEAGYGEDEIRMVGTGIKNGERAGLIAEQLNKLSTKEEKNEYINALYELGIMDEDDKVYDQLIQLKKEGKIKAPKDSQVKGVQEESPRRNIIGADELPVTQEFGEYNPEIEIFSGGINYGTDIGVGEGTPLAVPDGDWDVIESYDGDGMNDGYGRSVLIENVRTGEQIRLSHLSEVLADQGERLRPGEALGTSGNTGNTTGPHVDIEYYDEDGNASDILKSRYARNL